MQASEFLPLYYIVFFRTHLAPVVLYIYIIRFPDFIGTLRQLHCNKKQPYHNGEHAKLTEGTISTDDLPKDN